MKLNSAIWVLLYRAFSEQKSEKTDVGKAGEMYMESNIVLSMKDVSKTFPGVKALSHVDFKLCKGEIHALMGENGAGKSTLIKVLTGVHEFESGEIRMDGIDKAIINHSPQEAQTNGISTVM